MSIKGVNEEIKNRIRLSLFAYAYEFDNESLVPDHIYDRLSKEIRPEVNTGHTVMDKFFKEDFDPDTGMWVGEHPEFDKLVDLYERLTKGLPRPLKYWAYKEGN